MKFLMYNNKRGIAIKILFVKNILLNINIGLKITHLIHHLKCTPLRFIFLQELGET